MGKKRFVYGVGINDADYAINGKDGPCVFHRAWSSMLYRCYSEYYQKKYPTYKGCSVCKEWLTFSNFKKWMEYQDFEGKQLDKDILISGNKVYSPDACVFISSAVNSLLNDHGSARGKYKQGVTWCKRNNKFISQISLHGVNKNLGRYDTEQESHAAYVKAKSSYIREVADTQESKVRSALYRHAAELEKTIDSV